jgi:hypothetical protein
LKDQVESAAVSKAVAVRDDDVEEGMRAGTNGGPAAVDSGY